MATTAARSAEGSSTDSPAWWCSVVGSLSDRYGRVNTLIVSLLASVVSYAMMGMAGSLAMLFLSRIPVGILKQTMSISYAYVSDVTDSTSRAKYLG